MLGKGDFASLAGWKGLAPEFITLLFRLAHSSEFMSCLFLEFCVCGGEGSKSLNGFYLNVFDMDYT